MDCQNGLLFSNKNFELSFNLNKIIKSTNTYVTYAKDYDEFFTKLMNFKPDFVIFDLDTVNLPFEMLKTFVNKKVFNLKGVFFFSTKNNSPEKPAHIMYFSYLQQQVSLVPAILLL